MTDSYPRWFVVRRLDDNETVAVLSAKSPEMYDGMCKMLDTLGKYSMSEMGG